MGTWRSRSSRGVVLLPGTFGVGDWLVSAVVGCFAVRVAERVEKEGAYGGSGVGGMMGSSLKLDSVGWA